MIQQTGGVWTLVSALAFVVVVVVNVVVVDAQGQAGYRTCVQTKEEFMSHTTTGGDINDDPRNHLLCECREQTNNDDQTDDNDDQTEYMLLCSLYDSWDYCAPSLDGEEQVCASILFGQVFDETGQVTDRFRNYDYIEDRKGTMTVQRFPVENKCIVTVNAVQCKSCEIVETCPPMNPDINQQLYERGLPSSEDLGLFTDLKVDCTNVNPLSEFECGLADGAGNLLHILNGEPIAPEQVSTVPPVLPSNETDTDGNTTSVAPTEEGTEAPSTSLAPTRTPAPTAVPTLTAIPTLTAPPTGDDDDAEAEAKDDVPAAGTTITVNINNSSARGTEVSFLMTVTASMVLVLAVSFLL